MAYDTRAHELVMFGGFTQSGPFSDTWAWDGKGWTARNPRTIPTIQSPSMMYDPTNDQLVMAGSDTSTQPKRNVLWAWKDGDWKQQTVWETPSCGKFCPPNLAVPFNAGALTYDGAHSRMLMLAGAPSSPGSLTWTWDGSKWTQIPTAHRPLLLSCCFAHDPASGNILSLGYSGNSWGGINRLWVFDGSDWTLSPASTPSGNAMMIDDPSTGRPLLLRSPDIANPAPLETWEWDGSSWQRLGVTSPPIVTQSTLGNDAADKQVIFFGGLDVYGNPVSDTWIWNGRAWRKS